MGNGIRKSGHWAMVAAIALLAFHFTDAVENSGKEIPAIGCWFWHEREFEPDGYKAFIDEIAPDAGYDLLTTSLRVPEREITDPPVHDQIKAAVAYAAAHGMGIVLDLDLRLARAAFARAYPDELQEMIRLREFPLAESGDRSFSIASETLSDHYTHRAKPYVPMAGRLVRVYSYRRNGSEIVSDSVKDITSPSCRIEQADASGVRVNVSCSEETQGRFACVIVGFTHFVADVFAPHLLSFQRSILQQYSDLPLAGCCKDEWGFPPDFTGCPDKNDYWFSSAMASEYAERNQGRDLVRDFLLMWSPQTERHPERLAAINHYQKMCLERNAAVESDFYHAVKEVFGESAFVGTHPTWWPHPDRREFKKNGLDWWAVPRDWAQTDEKTPFAVRTSLAKKWNSPVWFNMFYSSTQDEYERELWSAVLGAGRINYHPFYPAELPSKNSSNMPLDPQLLLGEKRVRLLNVITDAPLDCPVAVLFGHACAMNWAGPVYDDVGLAVTDALWGSGYPADLIPLSELGSGALRVGDSGRILYGPQAYSAVVVYHPEFAPMELKDFLSSAATGDTALFGVGKWTTSFDGESLSDDALFPENMTFLPDTEARAEAVIQHLEAEGIEPQTPASVPLGWDVTHASPPRRGMARLIDGTLVFASGQENVAGDHLAVDVMLHERRVQADATGIFAIRLNEDGALEALAAAGLQTLRIGQRQCSFDEPVDIAVRRNEDEDLFEKIESSHWPVTRE